MREKTTNPRYYVDLALCFVVLVSSFVFLSSIVHWPPSSWDLQEAAIGGTVLVICFLISKERLLIIGVVLLYVASRSLLAMALAQDSWQRLEAALIGVCCALGGAWIARNISSRNEVYSSDSTVADRFIVIVVFGLISIGVLVVIWDAAKFYIRGHL